MQFNHTITIWTAVVKYDMYAADNKETRVKIFETYNDALAFVNMRRKEFVREFDIDKHFHEYGDKHGDEVYNTVNRDVYGNFRTAEDMLIAESDTQDRMFARVECHTL